MNIGHSIGAHVSDSIRDDTNSGFWHQIGEQTIEWVRVIIERFDPVRIEEWHTRDDERACPTCGQLDGRLWPEGEGFTPPIHDHCRCERSLHHLEWKVRHIAIWQRQIIATSRWEWRQTA